MPTAEALAIRIQQLEGQVSRWRSAWTAEVGASQAGAGLAIVLRGFLAGARHWSAEMLRFEVETLSLELAAYMTKLHQLSPPRPPDRAGSTLWQLSLSLECICGRVTTLSLRTPLPGGNDTSLAACPACLRRYRVMAWSDSGPLLAMVDTQDGKEIHSG